MAQPDSTWDVLGRLSKSLSLEAAKQHLAVRASVHRDWFRLEVSQGIEVMDNWTEIFEPVRKRRFGSERWTDIQSPEKAAAKVRTFLLDRPDQH